MVVAQLLERSLPTQEICGSNADIGNFMYYRLYLNCVEKTEVMK